MSLMRCLLNVEGDEDAVIEDDPDSDDEDDMKDKDVMKLVGDAKLYRRNKNSQFEHSKFEDTDGTFWLEEAFRNIELLPFASLEESIKVVSNLKMLKEMKYSRQCKL